MASDVNFRALFEHAPDNYLVVAPDPPRFTVVAANLARLRATSTRPEAIIGRSLFDVFPDDPSALDATAVRNLRESLDTVLRTGRPHRMGLQKYDVCTPAGELAGRYWEPMNSPIFDEHGALIYIVHRTEDVTERKQAEEAALRRTREEVTRTEGERYQLLVDMIPQQVWTTDAAGNHTYFSRRWYEYTGAMPEQTRGAGWSALLHPADRERTLARWRHSLETGEPYSIEYRFRRADGHYGWFLGQATPLRNDSGEIVEWFGTLTDISERKRLEQEREQLLAREARARATAEARARFLAEASSTLGSSLEYEETLQRVARLAVPRFADFCIVYRSAEGGGIRRLAVAARDPAGERRVGELERRYPVATGHPVAEVVRTGEAELYSEVADPLLEKIATDEEHLRVLREIGLRSMMIVPLCAQGRTLGAISFGRMQSRARYGEADLEVAEELARRAAVAIDNARLFEETRAARAEAERHAREEEALRKAAAAVGAAFSIEEMVNEIARSALAATDADSALMERIDVEPCEVVVAAVAGQRTLPFGSQVKYAGSLVEKIIKRGEPEFIPRLREASNRISRELLQSCPDCAALAVPLQDAGTPIGALILLREPGRQPFRPDEAERARTFADLAALAFRKVHLLEELERQRDELVRVMESRARLVRGFSHDVKNPLGAADGHLQLMEDGIVDHLTEKQRHSVSRARRSIRTALTLIEDLTALARAESGSIEVKCQPVDVRQVARELDDEYRARAAAEGLMITLELPDPFPLIETDAARVRQILGNLLSNATKYTRAGGITLRVATGEGASAPGPGRWVTVGVADTGPGMSPEQQVLAFQEFRRLETAGEATGAGIGLAISRRLARALGGDITVESATGEGSTFTLWLPLEGTAAAAHAPTKSTAPREGRTE